MLENKTIFKYADVLLWGLQKARNKIYQPGDIVLIRADLPALDLANVLLQKLLTRGLNPVLRLNWPPSTEKTFFTYAQAEQLQFKVPGEKELYSRLNGLISLLAPSSLTHLQDVEPQKIGLFTLARKYLRDILEQRENKQEFGWTLCLYPTQELAKKANLSLEQYSQQIIQAVYLDRAQPVTKWEEIYLKSQKVKKWLNSLNIAQLHVQSPNVDLWISPGSKRKWIGVSGHNIPSFEIFLSPDYRHTQGTYFANQPSYKSGNLVKGVRLTFNQGKVVEAKAELGQDFVRKQISLDQGASCIGEFSLTDKRFSQINKFMANTLFDENYGGEFGNCHIALGASYADTYAGDPQELTPAKKKELGFNDSGLHWDLVNTEDKTVTAHLHSGQKLVIYAHGEFALDL